MMIINNYEDCDNNCTTRGVPCFQTKYSKIEATEKAMTLAVSVRSWSHDALPDPQVACEEIHVPCKN